MRTLAALLFVGTAVFAQPAEPPECSADGIVVNSVTGGPIVRASVSGMRTAAVLTDSNGKWSLEHLPCGVVNFNASRQGYLANPPSRPLAAHILAAGVPLHDLTIPIVPQAVVTGTVLDEQGDPIQNGQIIAIAWRVIDGLRQFDSLGGSVPTNDIGYYRIAGLAASKYEFCANTGNHKGAAGHAYSEQCSGVMNIPAGYTGTVDFQLTPVTPRHVRGSISGVPEGASPQITLSGLAGAFAPAIHGDGTFDIEDVASGSYTLTATAFQENDRFIATLRVEVGNTDVDGIQLHIDKGLSVVGNVRIPATGKQFDNSRLSLSLIPSSRASAQPVQTLWSDDRTSFTITGVVPGDYRLLFFPPPPFYVEGATLGGRDIAGAEAFLGPGSPDIEVVLNDNAGSMEGDISSDEAPAVAYVLLQRPGAQPRPVRTDVMGHFRMEGLPPGDYHVSAWDDPGNVEYANPAWMQLNAKPVAVMVQPNQTATVKLMLQRAPHE